MRALAIVLLLAAGPTPTPAPSGLDEIAPGVHLLPGRFTQHQPDGNSVVFDAPAGLVIVDTGRHREQTQRLVDFAKGRGTPVVAIVNSHWHLDHVGGNVMLRESYPSVRVVATSAIDGALEGFLADYRSHLVNALVELAGKQGDAAREQAAGFRAEVALIDAGRRLAPDDVVTASGMRTLGGRELYLGLEGPAVTAGDVWALDPATHVLAAGDLVTVPVPFLDTACPKGWEVALGHLAKADFTLLVPGHGAPMRREELEAYRRAFGGLVACAASQRPERQCADAWFHGAGSQVAAADDETSRRMLHYYLAGVLRGDPAKLAQRCGG